MSEPLTVTVKADDLYGLHANLSWLTAALKDMGHENLARQAEGTRDWVGSMRPPIIRAEAR